MAVKDHSLDEKIVEAATAEFMEHGFHNASLRNIAKSAGLSTGALYTRYENKDVLFCSLVESVLLKIASEFEPMQNLYMEAKKSGDLEQIMKAIQQEEKIYLQILFEHYDECILFICRSEGSSIQKKLEMMMEVKAKQTVEFLKELSKRDVDFDGIELILTEQFQYYKLVLQKGYNKERAISCMKSVESFMEAGWKDLFARMM